MRGARFLAAGLALVLSACSGASQGIETTTSTSTTSTTTTTTTLAPTTTTSSTTTTSTTTTTLPGTPSALNGLPVADEALLERRVIAVKVDNHPNARPQSGLQEADAVIEILVEGGFTRLIALFHQSDSEYVGPVRSVRPTDTALLAVLDAPLATSGGQSWIQSLAASRGIPLIGEGSTGLFRMSHRRAPHNLYADTIDLRATADARGYDDDLDGWLYPIGEWEEDSPEQTADTLTLYWPYGHTVTWTYEDGRYLRFEGTRAHEWVDRDGNRGQLAYDVLVVIQSHQYAAGGGTGSSVPALETLGSGPLLIFAQGEVLEGTWERDAIEEPYRFLDSEGNPVVVPPGLPWISIFPLERPLDWS